MERSAASVAGSPTTVVVSVTRLLAESGSGVALVTDAELIIGLVAGTPAGAVARMPIRTRLPAGMSPRRQVTTVVPVHDPAAARAEITWMPGFMVAVSVTPAAADGPWFATVRKYESGLLV